MLAPQLNYLSRRSMLSLSRGVLVPMTWAAVQAAENRPKARTAVLITLTPMGFEPAEVTVANDPFLLALDNRTHLPQIQLKLSRSAGASLKERSMPRGRLRWREFLDLSPGVYHLTEAGHPAWRCTITVNK